MVLTLTLSSVSIVATPHPSRSVNDMRGENLSATRLIWAMLPPLIEVGTCFWADGVMVRCQSLSR